jgi:hypothetical protein
MALISMPRQRREEDWIKLLAPAEHMIARLRREQDRISLLPARA